MNTEVESRYVVPDRALFNRLRKLGRLGLYDMVPKGSVRVTDHYLDTRGRALMRQGWACRLRSRNGDWLLTLKGPNDPRGAILSRPELEISLPDPIQDVAHWPKGEIRQRVQQLTGGLPLQMLLTIKQLRHLFAVSEASRPVGELSLDVVRIAGNGLRHQSYMLECELLEGGRIADLEALDRLLLGEYGLIAEPRSKLRRALELVEQEGSPDQTTLPFAEPITAEALCRRYDVDVERAHRVADMADALFTALSPWHHLAEDRRTALRVAALLCDVGRHAGRKQRHIVGRDILLRQPILGLDDQQRHAVAAAAYLCRESPAPERLDEALPDVLPAAARQDCLGIAALVRLGRALGASAKRAVTISAVEEGDKGLVVRIVGERAGRTARRAAEQAGLWREVYALPLSFQADKEGAPVVLPRTALGILPTDTMRLAAGRALGYHLKRMLDHEEGTRLGEDPEELHDMRVATRRLRSALRLFGPYVAGPASQRVSIGLRRLGQALGAVRDMDVALQRAEAFGRNLGPEHNLDPLLETWRARRGADRRRLLRYLDGRTYQLLLRDLRSFVEDLLASPPAETERETVSHIAPRFLYIDWQIVRAYRAVLEDAPIELLHTLRIDCKRLRYGLEFFAEILPDEVVALIPEVVALQDHLGEMHDAAVAAEMVAAFLERRKKAAALTGVQAYRAACEAEMHARYTSFPEVWERFSTHETRAPGCLAERLRRGAAGAHGAFDSRCASRTIGC